MVVANDKKDVISLHMEFRLLEVFVIIYIIEFRLLEFF